MNDSGASVSAIQKYYRVYNQNTLIIHDELALNFGQLRLRQGGQAAGHNGIKSVIAHIGEDFTRLRIGITNEISPKTDSADFVLSKFNKEERNHIPAILREANSMINDYIFGGGLNSETRNVI